MSSSGENWDWKTSEKREDFHGYIRACVCMSMCILKHMYKIYVYIFIYFINDVLNIPY